MADELETHIAFLPGETKVFFGLWSPMGTEVYDHECMVYVWSDEKKDSICIKWHWSTLSGYGFKLKIIGIWCYWIKTGKVLRVRKWGKKEKLQRLAGCWRGESCVLCALGFSQAPKTWPIPAQGREIWPARPLVLGTTVLLVTGAAQVPKLHHSLLCHVSLFISILSFLLQGWRAVPRQTSGRRELYFKIIYCRVAGVLVQGNISPEQKLLFERQGGGQLVGNTSVVVVEKEK